MDLRPEPRGERYSEMPAHLENQEGEPERRPDPEPPPEVDELGVGSIVRGRRRRLERHAADRALSGGIADDLRVHRTGKARARGRRFGLGTVAGEASGRCFEAGPAPLRAEEERLPGVGGDLPGRGAIDGHAADRIARLEIVGGRSGELPAARLAAEAVRTPPVLERERPVRGADLHPADGIPRARVLGRLGRRTHRAVETPRSRRKIELPVTGGSRRPAFAGLRPGSTIRPREPAMLASGTGSPQP